MQGKKIITLLGICGLAACRQLPSPPEGVIPPDKMPPIVADLQVAETKVGRLTFRSYDSSKVAYQELERRVLKQYAIDSATYRKSYEFYAQYPQYLERIYQDAIQLMKDRTRADSAATRNTPPTERPTAL